MKENIVVIAGKLFKVDDTIIERGKRKFIINKLGNFYEDEVREASVVERFLYFMEHYKTRTPGRGRAGRPATNCDGLPGNS